MQKSVAAVRSCFLSALPSLVSWDLFLMPFQVSADSLCCGALAVHRALPGPRIARQRTFGDEFFTLCLLKSLVHRETWRLCCAAPCWHRLCHSLGFQVCMGWARAMAIPAQMQTGGTPCSLWNILSSLLEPCDHQLWHRAALERQCAHPQEESLCTF